MVIERPGLPEDTGPKFPQQAQKRQKGLGTTAQEAFADLADSFHLPPSFRAELEQDARIPKERFVQVQEILKRRAALEERGSVDFPFEHTDCVLRIHDGCVEMHVGGTVYNFTNQTIKEEWGEPLENFLKAIEAEGLTHIPREEAEKLFVYIQKNGKKHCEEAKNNLYGAVYIRAGKGFSRGLQFNKDGSIFIHFNKRKSLKDPRVGEGVFKKVRFAFDVKSGKRIVVATCKDKRREETLKREVAFQQRFQGKVGIAQVMQLIQVDGKYEGKQFFIQPYYNQGDLWHQVGKGLSLRDQLSITKDLLQGALALERAGIIHRDIKPSNIFLHRDQSGQMHAYIADFGVAVEEKEAQYRIAGTTKYLPPENQGQPVAQTMAGDMWAIGYSIRDMYMGKNLAEGKLPEPKGTVDEDPIAHLCYDLLDLNRLRRSTAREALAIYGPRIDRLLAQA